jgi:ABC-type lipoprotein export system ATPase subunit
MNSGINCRNLSVSFSTGNGATRTILDNLNATFPAGRISLVSGAIGAGKTTLLNVLGGLMRPTAGEVRVNDQAVSRWAGRHRDRWRRQTGMVFQHYHLLHDHTVLENVMLPLIPRGYTLGKCRRRSKTVLGDVALLHKAGSRAGTLSGGERQKAAVARALVARPSFVFADEPTAHQDPENAERIMALLTRCARRNAVVVVAAHADVPLTLPAAPLRFRLDGGSLHPMDL